MKKPMLKRWPRPVARPRLNISHEQLALLLEAMPEKYREFVRMAVEIQKPLSANALSGAEKNSVIRAFKKARESAFLPEMIFHDLTRLTVS